MSKFALLFVMIFFGGIAATLFYSGSASFVLYQLVYFLNPDERWWAAQIPGISYSFVCSILMLLALFLGYKRYSNLSPWNKQPIFKWLAAIVCIYYIVFFFAIDIRVHERFTFDFLKLVIIVMVAYKLLHSEKALTAAIWGYVIGATYIGYLATITGRNSGDRVEGIGLVDAPEANGTAAALVPAAALLMYYAWLGNKRVKLLCVICGALIANGLVLINSRGSFVGVVIGAGFFLLIMIFSKHRQKGQRAMAILIAVMGIGGAFYVADDSFWERMNTMTNLEDKSESGSGRVDFWLATFDMAKDYPMGTGVQGYNRIAEFYLGEKYRNKSVHSLWFQGLSEIGWIGITLFVLLIFSLYRQSRKARQWLLSKNDIENYFKVRAIECALLSYLISGSFINQFRSQVLYWMILLLAVAVNLYYLRNGVEQPASSRSNGKLGRVTI
jgi:hypothetical protein